jgi:hypothetical protein
MIRIEYWFVKKDSWPAGPWQSEPDKIQWTDKETNLPCLIVRNGYGALCGYVGVTKNHPAFGKDYDSVDVSVHGGLTYSAFCQKGPESETICHIPEPGEPDQVWWLGFDCAHSGDLSPAWESGLYGTYKPRQYVENEIADLAKQLKTMEA